MNSLLDLTGPQLAELPAVRENSSFSRQVPNLQLAVDSTSLGLFKTCPRKYQLSILVGLQGRDGNVHLEFGSWVHAARESYERERMSGKNHDDALDVVMDLALRSTWNSTLKRPWVSGHPDKHRVSLLRTIVWYLDEMAQNDPLETIRLANGSPAVELSFRFASGYSSRSSGEDIIFCGHLDRLARMATESYIPDIKTTTSSLGPWFFQSFTPGNQFSMYTLAGKVCFGVTARAVIVDGIEVKSDYSAFQRQIIDRPSGYVEEWYAGTAHWLRSMEACALEGSWPQNDTACGMYGGCEFRGICGKAPAQRGPWLKQGFTNRRWDPLQTREA